MLGMLFQANLALYKCFYYYQYTKKTSLIKAGYITIDIFSSLGLIKYMIMQTSAVKTDSSIITIPTVQSDLLLTYYHHKIYSDYHTYISGPP